MAEGPEPVPVNEMMENIYKYFQSTEDLKHKLKIKRKYNPRK